LCLYSAVKELRVDVETTSVLSAGQTVCDVWGQGDKAPNARVCVAMDVGEFWKMMCDAVDKADKACPPLETNKRVREGDGSGSGKKMKGKRHPSSM
jgi:hypothetical protein